MENQYQTQQNCEVEPIVIDNLISMFGDVTTRDVIVAVIESCGGDLNLAVEGIMNITSDQNQQSEADRPSNSGTGLNIHNVKEIPAQISHCSSDIQHQQQNQTITPLPTLNITPIQSYATASQNTGAIPKKTLGTKPVSQQKHHYLPSDQFNKVMRHHNEGTRILIILRGVPGSGKSYLAKEIVKMTIGPRFEDYKKHVFSTDDYFMVRGAYSFDRFKLSDAHAWNHRRVWIATQQGLSPIIVDNTNVEIWEMEPYVRHGVSNGYVIEIMEPKTPWAKKLHQLARKNTHGVPMSSIKHMLDNFQDGITGESLRIKYGYSYPVPMTPPVKRIIPAIEKPNLVTTTISGPEVQICVPNVAVNTNQEDLSTFKAVIEQPPCVVMPSPVIVVETPTTNAIESNHIKETKEITKFDENKLEDAQEKINPANEEINQNKIYMDAQKQLEQLHKFELAWERGENWEENKQEKDSISCEGVDEAAVTVEPKPQRKIFSANSSTENVASCSTENIPSSPNEKIATQSTDNVDSSSTATLVKTSADRLMESMSKCQDWQQISMFMPPWQEFSPSNSSQTPIIPTMTVSSATCMEIGDTVDNGSKFKVISAQPRDINEFYVPLEKEKIPDKRMLDKSSMTADHEITEVVRCKNEEKHFISFRKLFKNISRTHLRDIFDQCRGDVNWAVEIVLDGMANNELAAVTEELSDQDDEVLEECHCISNYHVIPNLESSSAENKQETKNEPASTSPAESEPVTPIKRKIKKDVSDSSLELKRQIEQNVAISESHYSDHCLKIRKMRRGEHSNNLTVTEEDSGQASTSVSPVNTTDTPIVPQEDGDNSDDEESTTSADELEHVVDVNLGRELVQQLDVLFGRKDMQYPENTVFNISIPMSLLNEMNALWMESFMNQLDDHKKQSALMLKQDEEFARALEMKELELAQAGLEPEVPDFKEIMDMDLAIALYHKDAQEWRNNAPTDLAARLSREKLFNLFPEVSPDVLSELLMAHDNNFQSTVEGLLVSTGRASVLSQKNGVNKFVMEKEIERREKVLMEEQKTLSEVEWPPLPKGEPVEMSTVHEYREEADMHLVRRHQSYIKAQDYVRRGMTLVANHYSEIAAYHKMKFEQANSLAAASLVQFHAQKRDTATIDLHYLRVNEAKEALDLFLDSHIQKLKENKNRGGPSYHVLYFITGRGLHSPGLPRIKPAVKKRLTERGLSCSERNPGLLTSRVCAEDLLSYQIKVP